MMKKLLKNIFIISTFAFIPFYLPSVAVCGEHVLTGDEYAEYEELAATQNEEMAAIALENELSGHTNKGLSLYDIMSGKAPAIFTHESTESQSSKSVDLNSGATVTTYGSAPSLSILEVVVVDSTQSGWEPVDQFAYSTSRDHGGTLMVWTGELGYGYTGIAKLNGVNCPQTNSIPITQGGIVTGWYKQWNCTGQNSGQFIYSNTSINGGNTMTDWIYIQ